MMRALLTALAVHPIRNRLTPAGHTVPLQTAQFEEKLARQPSIEGI
jgi:hypothetical protein